MRSLICSVFFSLGTIVCFAQSPPAQYESGCGEVIALQTHSRSTTRYAFVLPPKSSAQGGVVTLVLLAGGSGHVALDEQGCPQALKGNSLVRSIPIFHALGLGTALIDAPSDHHGEDGLGGFRITPAHAEDLGRVIADLRTRTQGAVWIVGTSRGSISAANAAARLSGPLAPDGVVLTSALMAGQTAVKKSWVAQTVFDLPLEEIRQPLLVVGHAADQCARSPAELMGKIVARTQGVREQVVTVIGGAAVPGPSSLYACEGRSPHGFIGQESEVAEGLARFVRGGIY